MATMTKYPPNTFCWPELTTSDSAGAKKFYADLFGWNMHDDPVGPDAVYTMCRMDDDNVGAMFELNAEMKKQGIPPHWKSYVSVASADDTAAKAKALGGTVMMDPFDVMDVGRMTVVADPQGAVFALWQPKIHIGAQRVNAPGALTWNELMTTDTVAARKFYTELFGWGANTQDMGGFQYTSFTNGERPAGGMMQITAEMGPVPPNWMNYFGIDDADAAAAKTKAAGGTVVVPPQDIPEVGRFTTLMDPQGAAFAVIQLANPPE